MIRIEKFLAVSFIAITAVTAAHAKIVTQTNVVGTNGVSVSVPASGATNAGKLVISGPDLSGKQDVLTFSNSGSGNVVTAVSKSGSTVTVTKGTTLGSLATKSTVASADIANGTIVAEDLASDAVETAKIKNANVTAPKLADGVVASGSDNVTVTRDSTTSAFKISVTAQDISGKEDTSNKVTATSGTDYTSNKTSTTKYPSMATAGQIATDAINALDVSTATNGGTANNVVTAVTETNGKISVTKGDAINAVAATASSGTGNVITGISLNADGHTLDFQKGITALTSHQDISGKQDKLNSGTGGNVTITSNNASASGVVKTITASDGSVSVVRGTIATGDITDSAVTSAKIADGTITTSDISSSAGITKGQLASAVQTSLGKADTALQASDIVGKVDVAQGSGNVDKVMITNASGNVTTTKFVHTSADNGSNVYSATAPDKDTTIPSVELVEDIAARAAGEYVAKDQTSSNANKTMITNASGQVVPVAITNSGSGFVTGISISNGAVTVSKSAIGAANVASGLVEGTAPITVSRNSTSGVYTVAATAGSVADGNTGLINGDKVYDEVRAAQTSNGTGYLGAPASTTTATNLTNLDTALKTIHPNTGEVKIPSGSETSSTLASIWVE